VRVNRLPLNGTNAYVISDKHHALIDTGPERSRTSLLNGLASIGLCAEDLSLIVVTHAHATAVGNVAWLQRTFHVPVAVHGADAPILASGINRHARTMSPVGLLLKQLGDARFEAAAPDVVFGHSFALESFGTRGTVVHTPGHTIGSASVILPTGDAIVGDLLMGGWFGGRLLPHRPARHYLAEIPQQVVRSLLLLQRLGVQRLHPGTGDVLEMDEVQRLIIARAREFPSGPTPTRLRERRLREDPTLAKAK